MYGIRCENTLPATTLDVLNWQRFLRFDIPRGFCLHIRRFYKEEKTRCEIRNNNTRKILFTYFIVQLDCVCTQSRRRRRRRRGHTRALAKLYRSDSDRATTTATTIELHNFASVPAVAVAGLLRVCSVFYSFSRARFPAVFSLNRAVRGPRPSVCGGVGAGSDGMKPAARVPDARKSGRRQHDG